MKPLTQPRALHGLTAASAILSLALSCPAETPLPAVVPDVVYGHKAGMALTYDVIKPVQPNRAAVLFMVSGGWVSGWSDPAPLLAGAMAAKDRNAFGMLLDKGFTLILVRHGSSPYFKVPDAVADVRRAVRHIRMTAATHGIDEQRLGVFGGSAGGHLSLMLGTASDNGNPSASDPVEKMSSRIAAVTAYYPPTDLAGYIGDARFPALHFPATQSDALSPLKQVTADDAPSLLVHGGKDTLVTLSHSENILAAFKKAGVPTDLLTFPEAGHHFAGPDEKAASTALTAWFEKYLLPAPAVPLSLPELPLGTWETKATLPDGGTRPGVLTVSQQDGKPAAIISGEHGERKLDRIVLNDGTLKLEIDFQREDRPGIIRVSASKTSEDKFTGSWEVVDDAGTALMKGAWEAVRKAP